MSHRHTSIGVVLLLLVGCAFSRTALGDTIILKSGARIVGEVVPNENAEKGSITLKTAEGVQVTLNESQIKQWLRQKPAELEYEKIRSRYPDTVEGQWELAEWCRERKLNAQRETHLKRILELDPDHEKAHFGLGHTRLGGQWMTQDDFRRKQGLVMYKGRWRTPQEKELEEEKHRTDLAEKEWKKKLKLWRQQLDTNRVSLAKDNIREIDSPMAAQALGDAMLDEREPAVRLLYVQALAKIDTDKAKAFLRSFSILDHDEEVRMACVEHVKKTKGPETLTDYFKALRDKTDNRVINQAAAALKELGDKAAIGPLIDALVSEHKERINTGNSGQMSASFGSGGTGMSMGGGSPTFRKVRLNNRSVLDALVALAGGPNFGYDKDAWKAWYVSQRKSQINDSRRN